MLFLFYVNKGARLLELDCDKARMRELYADFIVQSRSSDFTEFKKYLQESRLDAKVVDPVYFTYGGADNIEMIRDVEPLATSEVITIGAPHANKLYALAKNRNRTPAQQIVRMMELYSSMEQFAGIIGLIERGELGDEFKD